MRTSSPQTIMPSIFIPGFCSVLAPRTDQFVDKSESDPGIFRGHHKDYWDLESVNANMQNRENNGY